MIFIRLTKSLVILFLFVGAAATAYSLVAVRGTFVPAKPISAATGIPIAGGMPGHRVLGRLYLVGLANPKAPLVVVIHGDAPFANPGYQYEFASSLARAVPGTRVVGVLRPGYSDPFGAKSDGDRGFAVGENYTDEVESDLAAAIESLRATWGTREVFIVGHSGGAAIAAGIAAKQPRLAAHIFLISCPCDVPAFRSHMATLNWDPFWLIPTRSISPLTIIDRLQASTAVTAVSGDKDPIALPIYAKDFVDRALMAGIKASIVLIPGSGHEILNNPQVVSIVSNSVREEESPSP